MKIEKILFQGKSDYQNVMVFQVTRTSKDVIVTFLPLFVYNHLNILMLHFLFTVIDLWKGSCPGRGDSADRKG